MALNPDCAGCNAYLTSYNKYVLHKKDCSSFVREQAYELPSAMTDARAGFSEADIAWSNWREKTRIQACNNEWYAREAFLAAWEASAQRQREATKELEDVAYWYTEKYHWHEPGECRLCDAIAKVRGQRQ